jgi:hypothetical protein
MFLNNVNTGDETLRILYHPQPEHQSCMRKSKLYPRKANFHLSKSKRKAMLEVLYDAQGLVNREFIPEGRAANREICGEMLLCLKVAVRREHPETRAQNSRFLLRDGREAPCQAK